MKLILALLVAFSARAQRGTERLDCPLKIRNQGQTSLCWLHSGLQMMEQMAGEPMSIDAILVPEIKSRALARFLGHDTPWDGGAGPTRPFALALEHGLVPEAIWNKDGVLVQNYHRVFERIEELLGKNLGKTEFLAGVDEIIKSYTGTLPPMGHKYTRELIGGGASLGYDFRDVKYDDSKYGRMGDVAWTTIISRRNELVKITDIIEKKVIRESAEEAWNHAIEIFRAKRPVAFTFIWFDQDGQTVLGLNGQNEYVSRRPPAVGGYMGSHLVLVTGLVSEGGQVTALEVHDSTASVPRFVTKEFFFAHGKTVHAIEKTCEGLL
jgi:hypothetical protein